jgi:hypothetical protein
MKGHESNTKLKDASFLQKVWLSLEFIFLPYHLMMVFLVMILSFITSPALLNIRFQVDFIVFCTGLIFPLTICIALTLSRKDQAYSYLTLIKTEIRSLRIMFSCFNAPQDEDEPSFASEAEPLLQKIAVYTMCLCRNDQEGQVPKMLWSGERAGSNAAAHYIADCIASISALLGRAERQHKVYDTFKDGWAHIVELSKAVEGLKAVRFSALPAGFLKFNSTFVTASSLALVPYWNSFCKSEVDPSAEFSPFTVSFDDAAGGTVLWSVLDGANGTAVPPATGEAVIHPYGCVTGYLLAALYALTVLMLHSVQSEMEDPFDGKGKDDIRWDDWRDGLLPPDSDGAQE